ncbi:MAG: hypothetical protein AAGN66_01610 [Acidobacteriota bacterium]
MRRPAATLAVLTVLAFSSPSEADDSVAQGSRSDRFRIHGFISQAWADASIEGPKPSLLFTNQPDLVFGIPEDGTFKYHTLALQLRYAFQEQTTFVLQVDYENAGDDLIASDKGVELDWAFLAHRFKNGLDVKLGRIPTPIGLFNEIRDVGVLLPFYRPAGAFYGEGNLHSATIDGLLISQSFFRDKAWILACDAYFGTWDIPEVFSEPTGGLQVREARARDVVGAQLWLENRQGDIRLGLGGNLHDGTGGVLREALGETDHESWHASVEATVGSFTGRAEYRYRSFGPLTSPRAAFDSEFENYYFQVGYRFDEHLSVWLQWDSAVLETFVLPPQQLDQPSVQDPYEAAGPAIAVNYAFTPKLVLKAEYHHAERDLTTTIVPVAPPLVFRLQSESQETRYSILSLSYAF